MSSGSFADRARLTLFTANNAKRSVLGVLRRSAFLRWRYTGPPAQRLLLVPPDLHTADPSLAHEFNEGLMGLAGTVAVIGHDSPFAVTPPSLDWQRELHSFSWLRNLSATQDPEMRELARDLVRDWIIRQKQQRGLPWDADIVSRRMVAWLSNSDFLLTNTDQRFYDLLLANLTRKMHFLVGSYEETPDGAPRLRAMIAVLLAGLCMSDQKQLVARYKTAFLREINRQILADGGHISRNPTVVIELLLDLLPLRQCFIVREEKPPKDLTDAINRMLPLVRFFRMGDGALARFHGSGYTPFDSMATVLAYEDVKLSLPKEAPASGFYKLENGDKNGLQVLVDAGPPPPFLASSTAHASCLSFELSIGRFPVLVNCGAPPKGKLERRIFSRRTEAHNTLMLNGCSSSVFLDRAKFDRFYDAPFLSEPGRVKIKSLTGPVSGQKNNPSEKSRPAHYHSLTARHDGYVKRFAVWHERTLTLLNDGNALQGRDGVIPAAGFKGVKFAIRFHLHPTIEIEKDENSTNILYLTLPDKSRWTFSATGPVFCDVIESIYLAYRHGAQNTNQIILTGLASGKTFVEWKMEKWVAPPDLSKPLAEKKNTEDALTSRAEPARGAQNKRATAMDDKKDKDQKTSTMSAIGATGAIGTTGTKPLGRSLACPPSNQLNSPTHTKPPSKDAGIIIIEPAKPTLASKYDATKKPKTQSDKDG